MSCWLTIPSARPPEEAEKALSKWRAQGYKIALMTDDQITRGVDVQLVSPPFGYPGYAAAINQLVAMVMGEDAGVDWFVIGGDDVHPDPNHSAEEIAAQCCEYFMFHNAESSELGDAPELGDALQRTMDGETAQTFGVMQPTGDRWGESPNHRYPAMRSAYIDRVAGSAWLGREFCKRVIGGRGPLWSGNPDAENPIDRQGYKHMFVDEELRAVAVKLGIYWERRDLTHYHAHAGRVPNYTSAMIPPHLRKWNSATHWREAQALYSSRRDRGFPGSEPI